MNVLVDATTYTSLASGAARRCVELWSRVAGQKSDLRLVVWHRPEMSGVMRARFPEAVLVEYAGESRGPVRRMFGHGKALRRLVTEHSIDRIIQDTLPPTRPAMTIPTIHDLRDLYQDLGGSTGRRLYARFRAPRRLERCPAVVTVSETMAEEIRGAWPVIADRLHVVPNGIDPVPFRDPNSPRGALERHRLTERPFVLAVGHREPRKNLPMLIRAAAIWRDQELPHGLVIVGRKVKGYDEPEDLVRALGLQGDVLFAEDVTPEELPALYRQADVFGFYSRYEGFGIPLLEAAAAGTPIVAARTPVFEEVIGERAIAELDTPAEFATEVLRIVRDEQARVRAIDAGTMAVEMRGWGVAVEALRHVL